MNDECDVCSLSCCDNPNICWDEHGEYGGMSVCYSCLKTCYCREML